MKTEAIEHLMQRGMWQEAAIACRAKITEYPGAAKPYAFLGLCQFYLGEYEQSAAALRRAIILDPGYLDAGIKLAEVLVRLDRHIEAREVAKQFLVKYPMDPVLMQIEDQAKRHVGSRHLENRDFPEPNQSRPKSISHA